MNPYARKAGRPKSRMDYPPGGTVSRKALKRKMKRTERRAMKNDKEGR